MIVQYNGNIAYKVEFFARNGDRISPLTVEFDWRSEGRFLNRAFFVSLGKCLTEAEHRWIMNQPGISVFARLNLRLYLWRWKDLAFDLYGYLPLGSSGEAIVNLVRHTWSDNQAVLAPSPGC